MNLHHQRYYHQVILRSLPFNVTASASFALFPLKILLFLFFSFFYPTCKKTSSNEHRKAKKKNFVDHQRIMRFNYFFFSKNTHTRSPPTHFVLIFLIRFLCPPSNCKLIFSYLFVVLLFSKSFSFIFFFSPSVFHCCSLIFIVVLSKRHHPILLLHAFVFSVFIQFIHSSILNDSA